MSFAVGDRVIATGIGGPLPMGAIVTQHVIDDSWWIDMCMMGQHLPQMYREAELAPLVTEADAYAAGLCRQCLGFGTHAPADSAFLASVDQVNACVGCGGTGRECLRLGITRSPSSVQGKISVLAHDLVLGASGLCNACGMEPTDRNARHAS